MAPLVLESRHTGLQGARAALTPAPRRPLPAWAALICAGLMAVAAMAAVAAVVLGSGEPFKSPTTGSMRGRLTD